MEYQVSVGGVMYGMERLRSVSITSPLFDKFSAGNACSAELDMEFWPSETVPRMAEIVPYCRESSDSAWQQLGVFYIDTRSVDGTLMSVVAYDSMLRAENEWEPDQSLTFPMKMEAVANEIAGLMGVELDSRCAFNSSYTVDYPANEYTLRDVLRYIAGAHGGNWIVTAENRLLLIPLGAEPPETHYLVTEDGDAIVFGEDRILV